MPDEVNNEILKDLINLSPESRTSYHEEMLLDKLREAFLYMPFEITSKNFDYNFNGVKEGYIIEIDEPFKFKPLVYTDKNNISHLFLFTDKDELKNGIKGKLNVFIITSSDIAENFKKANYDYVDINPFSKCGISMKFSSFLNLFNDESYFVFKEE
ncbi:hypothetical protein BGI41_04930 [Methanobrevibacter sp. 87.7]|uniref:SseB family protein n=1 Tax=Methanobrevibacter sp. 87.7 TaxID=387957 RepID=UPI000B50198D|nr:SseB family protein [Methanobrevibacter sp. 87.7]OWT32955.1 hypothetical protein BGI41_04930 [Methanobrevibacter sp. 87.7]